MGLFSRIVAMTTLLAWMGLHANPAAAQNFEDRFSIVPKANAAEPDGPIEPVPQTQPSTSRRRPRSSFQRRLRESGRSVRNSLCQTQLHRKGLVLFVPDRKNSERFIVQPGFA